MRNMNWITLGIVPLTLISGCATARIKVAQSAPPTVTRFDRVAVPAFANGVGSALPVAAPENIAGAVIATLQKAYPAAFRAVSPTPSNQPGELLVRGKITDYDPGSKAARAILIGLGAGDLDLEIELVDAATGQTVERFSTSGEIMAGGLVGAMMGVDDMINSAAGKIAERVAKYGSGG